MISRRAALGSILALTGIGAAGWGLRAAGILDDGLRAVGVRPHREPDPHDVELLAAAAAGQQSLLTAMDAMAQRHTVPELRALRSVVAEQLAAVTAKGAATTQATPTPVPGDHNAALASLAALTTATADARATDALTAGSHAVIKVLASMAAGLDQIAVSLKAIA